MKRQLIRLANHLDKIGFYKEADYLDVIIKKAEEESDKIDKLKSDFIEVFGPEKEDLNRTLYALLNDHTSYPHLLEGRDWAHISFSRDLIEVVGFFDSYIELSQKIKNKEQLDEDDHWTLIMYSTHAVKFLKRNNLTLTESGAKIIIDNLEKLEREYKIHDGDVSGFSFSESTGRGDSARNSLDVFSKIIENRKEELNQYYYGVLEKMRDYSYYNFPRFDEIEGGPPISSEKAYSEVIKLLNEDVGLTYEITVNQILNILKSSER